MSNRIIFHERHTTGHGLAQGAGGVTVAPAAFTDAAADFAGSGVLAGDTLTILSPPADAGGYIVTSVTNPQTLAVAPAWPVGGSVDCVYTVRRDNFTGLAPAGRIAPDANGSRWFRECTDAGLFQFRQGEDGGPDGVKDWIEVSRFQLIIDAAVTVLQVAIIDPSSNFVAPVIRGLVHWNDNPFDTVGQQATCPLRLMPGSSLRVTTLNGVTPMSMDVWYWRYRTVNQRVLGGDDYLSP